MRTCVALTGMLLNENLPSMSLTVPVFVPTTTIEAPTTGSPFSDTMVPVICLDCAETVAAHTIEARDTNNSLLPISNLVVCGLLYLYSLLNKISLNNLDNLKKDSQLKLVRNFILCFCF